MNKKKILFGTPLCKSTVHASYTSSTISGLFYLLQRGFDCQYSTISHADVATNRNILCRDAIDSCADYLIFCDDDMSFDRDDLLAMIEADKDCIASTYVGKRLPADVLITSDNVSVDNILARASAPQFVCDEQKTPFTRGQIIESAFIGTGLMVIKVSMLKALIKKGAVHKYTAYKNEGLYNFFRFNYSGDGQPVGEDFNFCKLIRENGYGLSLYVTDRTRHYGDYGYRLAL